MALNLLSWRSPLFPLMLVFSVATRIAAQPTTAQSVQRSVNELKLTVAEEKDSYQIYSILLRTEMPRDWKIGAWAIDQETRTYPGYRRTNAGSSDICLQPPQDQESIYLPLIEDYVVKNKKKLILERKFDLPEYALIGPVEIKTIQERWQRRAGSNFSSNSVDVDPLKFSLNATVIFHVSAVGFNRDGTRALVYVGHNCGGLCGGGTYHLLVKKDGQWQIDREYRGRFCMWVS